MNADTVTRSLSLSQTHPSLNTVHLGPIFMQFYAIALLLISWIPFLVACILSRRLEQHPTIQHADTVPPFLHFRAPNLIYTTARVYTGPATTSLQPVYYKTNSTFRIIHANRRPFCAA